MSIFSTITNWYRLWKQNTEADEAAKQAQVIHNIYANEERKIYSDEQLITDALALANAAYIKKHNLKINTSYDPKPIPPREFDWQATDDDYDIGSPIGYGSTEQKAIADLIEQLED